MHRANAARLEEGIIVGVLECPRHLFLQRGPERVYDPRDLVRALVDTRGDP